MKTTTMRHGARAAALAALMVATAFGGVATAGAAPAGTGKGGGAKPVEVKIGTGGIQAPKSAPAGLVAFHVRTDDPAGHILQTFRPHTGVSVATVLEDFATAIGSDPAAAAKAIGEVRDEADLFGGAQVTPSVSGTFTTPITAGPVVLLDFSAFLADPAHPVYRTLKLTDSKKEATRAHFPDAVVITEETAAGPRFDVHGLDRADETILVRNSADEIHEMALLPVKPGTTDADVEAAFTVPGTPPPFTGPPVGLGPISPERSALLELEDLPAGRYALVCFVPSDENGAPHVALGMHKVIDLA